MFARGWKLVLVIILIKLTTKTKSISTYNIEILLSIARFSPKYSSHISAWTTCPLPKLIENLPSQSPMLSLRTPPTPIFKVALTSESSTLSFTFPTVGGSQAKNTCILGTLEHTQWETSYHSFAAIKIIVLGDCGITKLSSKSCSFPYFHIYQQVK